MNLLNGSLVCTEEIRNQYKILVGNFKEGAGIAVQRWTTGVGIPVRLAIFLLTTAS
jgi:hypothetical protein